MTNEWKKKFKIDKIEKAYQEGGFSTLTYRTAKFTYQLFAPKPIRSYLRLIFKDKAIAYPKGENWKIIRYNLHTWKNPSISETIGGTLHGSPKHVSMMEKIYNYPNFVEVEEGDIVFEVGAHVGGFTRFAAQKADRVIAIDPNASIDSSLEYNMKEYNNVSIVPKAAWKEKDTIEINKSKNFADNSIFEPDDKDLKESYTVAAQPISEIAKEQSVREIDYLKIEAEGAEPEILKSALSSDLTIHKIAVDATEERGGEDVIEEITGILEEHDYKTGKKDSSIMWGEKIVFGKI